MSRPILDHRILGPMILLVSWVLLVGFLLHPSLLAQMTTRVAVDALVTDADGKPLAGVEFGDHWRVREGRLGPAWTMAGPWS